jgi:prolyl 4-hydroxylase
LPVPLFEASQVLHYSVGQQFKPHHDFLDPANPAYDEDLMRFGQRIATFLIYLNEGYRGGETSFPEIGFDYRANEGDALFYANVTGDGRPDPLTLHAGLPPTFGEKWVFSQWIRDRFPKD